MLTLRSAVVNPELVWDFRLPTVVSINTSGHKYGLVYCGVGWCIWRGKAHLPDEIVFTVNYLGSPQSSVTLNFSKGERSGRTELSTC